MADRTVRQMNGRYVSGNLAHDYDYLERERRRRAERERWDRLERRAREPAARPRPRRPEAFRRRERIEVSNAAVLGAIAVAALVIALLMSYARLSAISNQVVQSRRELASLEAEHVKLVARYERVFDLSAIKEAAEAAGMAKPSASQIYHIDLSAPDHVVLYQQAEANVLGRACATVGESVRAVLEYFE